MALPPPASVPDQPLALARKRLRAASRPPKLPPPKIPQKKGRRPRVVSPDLVIGMKAAGVPLRKIAQALQVDEKTVDRSLTAEPGSRERILDLREKLKDLKMQRSHQVQGRIWSRLEKEVDEGAAKDVDAISRSLLALEKIEAAASGEAHASGSVAPPVTNLELKALIQVLVGSEG